MPHGSLRVSEGAAGEGPTCEVIGGLQRGRYDRDYLEHSPRGDLARHKECAGPTTHTRGRSRTLGAKP